MSVQLDLLNYLLVSIDETPVDEVVGSHPDASTAMYLLGEKRKELLRKGWWFNRQERYLSPDSSGLIVIPTDTLSVSRIPSSSGLVSVRGNLLYDNENDTNVFTAPQLLELLFDFPDYSVPGEAYAVIKYSAALEFALSSEVSNNKIQNLRDDLATAERYLLAQQLRQKKQNFSNPPMRQRLGRTTNLGYIPSRYRSKS